MLNNQQIKVQKQSGCFKTPTWLAFGIFGTCLPAAYLMPVIYPYAESTINKASALLTASRFFNPNYSFVKSFSSDPFYYAGTAVTSFVTYNLVKGFEGSELQDQASEILSRDNSNLFALAKFGALLPAVAAVSAINPPLVSLALAIMGVKDLALGEKQSDKSLGKAQIALSLITFLFSTSICEAGFNYLYVAGPVIAGLSIVAAKILSSLNASNGLEKIEAHISSIPNNFMDNEAAIWSAKTGKDQLRVKATLRLQHNMYDINPELDGLSDHGKTLNSAVAAALFFKMIDFNPRPEIIKEMSATFRSNGNAFNSDIMSDEQIKQLVVSVQKGKLPNFDGIAPEEMKIIRENFDLARSAILHNRREAAR